MKGWKGRGKGKKEGMDEIDEINETIRKKGRNGQYGLGRNKTC